MVDFEFAAVNADAANFPGVEMKGCFYHLTSNLWKRIQRVGLQERYNNDANFANTLRMIAALAFVPPQDEINYFEQLSGHIRIEYGDDCDEVLQYMEDNYIVRLRVNAPRRAPTFSIRIRNMFHQTFDELPRTNNSIEEWHRSSKLLLG